MSLIGSTMPNQDLLYTLADRGEDYNPLMTIHIRIITLAQPSSFLSTCQSWGERCFSSSFFALKERIIRLRLGKRHWTKLLCIMLIWGRRWSHGIKRVYEMEREKRKRSISIQFQLNRTNFSQKNNSTCSHD
jgi:hypothetical protein